MVLLRMPPSRFAVGSTSRSVSSMLPREEQHVKNHVCSLARSPCSVHLYCPFASSGLLSLCLIRTLSVFLALSSLGRNHDFRGDGGCSCTRAQWVWLPRECSSSFHLSRLVLDGLWRAMLVGVVPSCFTSKLTVHCATATVSLVSLFNNSTRRSASGASGLSVNVIDGSATNSCVICLSSPERIVDSAVSITSRLSKETLTSPKV